jgi:oxalate decarboxylase/phosphoglucose isomerase-like protein (cupin superfamily)
MNLKDINSHVDVRGKIQMVLESCKIGSISRIESEPGTWRARHYHKTDSHWILVNEGQIEIYEREVGGAYSISKKVLNKGDVHYTGPMVEHEMVFPCWTSFDCYSFLSRDSNTYEGDLVRFEKSLKEEYDNIPF